MTRLKFDQIAVNSTVKKKPEDKDRERYVGLEHLDPGMLEVTRWGAEVTPKGDKLLMKKGDVLFGRRRAYQKKVGIAPFDGIFSAHGMVLRPKVDVVDPEFFPFFISSDTFLDEAIRVSVGSLSPTANWKDLKSLEFNLPSLETQHVLAGILSEAEQLKKHYRDLLTTCDDVIKSQFVEMFGDPFSNSKGLTVKSVKQACSVISDGPFGSNLKSSHYADRGIRVIRLGNVKEGHFDDSDRAFITEEHYKKLERYTCHPGDVIVGTLGEPNLRACLVPDYIPISINKSDCVHIVPKPDELLAQYACAYFNMEGTLRLAKKSMHGNTRSRISMSQVASLPIPIPPLPMQQEFADFATSVDKSKFMLGSVGAKL